MSTAIYSDLANQYDVTEGATYEMAGGTTLEVIDTNNGFVTFRTDDGWTVEWTLANTIENIRSGRLTRIENT